MGRKRKEESELQRKPHFFKVLIGEFKHRLKMPPNFLKHLSNEASIKAILEGPNGCSWLVEITRSFDGTFISAGWSKFVEDHSLKEGEFLVFRYNGNMHFSIQVFDTTACEREDLFPVQSDSTPKLSKGGKKRGRPRKQPPDVCHIERQEIKSEPQALPTYNNHEAKHMQGDIINPVEDPFLLYKKLKLIERRNKRGRGGLRKHPPEVVRRIEHQESEDIHTDNINSVEDPFLLYKKLRLIEGGNKRGRGRPRKHPPEVVCRIEHQETKSKGMHTDVINSVEDPFLFYEKLKLIEGGNKRGRGRPRKHPPEVVRRIDHQETKGEDMHTDIINSVEGGRKRGRPRKHPPDVVRHIKHQENKSEHMHGDIINSVEVNAGSCVPTLTHNEEGKVKPETELSFCSIGSENPNRRGYFSRRRPVPMKEQLRAEEAARSFSSDLPFVIRPMALSSMFERMRFPRNFSRKHLPRKKTNMTLRDPNGKSWTVAYVAAEQDRDRLSIGWGEFAQANNLNIGDYCAFELIGPNEMRVHIFRAIEEIIPAVEETTPAVETSNIVVLD